MLSGIIAGCLLAVSIAAASPKAPIPRLGDSVVACDTNGTVLTRSRVYYDQNNWIDSMRGFDVPTGFSYYASSIYTLHEDTLIQFRFYYGEPSSETSRYICNNSDMVQKQLHYRGDTLIEIIYYYYNQAGKLVKQAADNISNQWASSDSVIFNYDNENHLVSSMEYFSSVRWSYAEFEHDAQGRPSKLIEFEENSTTQKSGWYAIMFYLGNNPIRNRFAITPKKPGIRVDQNGTFLSFDPKAASQIRVYDARGVLLKNTRPKDFISNRQGGIPCKAYFIKAVANNGTIVGKKINVR